MTSGRRNRTSTYFNLCRLKASPEYQRWHRKMDSAALRSRRWKYAATIGIFCLSTIGFLWSQQPHAKKTFELDSDSASPGKSMKTSNLGYNRETPDILDLEDSKETRPLLQSGILQNTGRNFSLARESIQVTPSDWSTHSLWEPIIS